MEQLYAQYSSSEEFLTRVQRHFEFSEDSVQMLLLNYFLYLYHIHIVPEYRELLFGPIEERGEG